VARSRSLWDQALPLPADPGFPGTRRLGHAVLDLQDAQGHALLAVSRPLQLPDADAPPLRLTVAADQALLAEPLQRFTTMLLVALGLLAGAAAGRGRATAPGTAPAATPAPATGIRAGRPDGAAARPGAA
jgi:hypothetical protein